MPPSFTDLQGGFELGPWTVVPERGLLRQGTVREHLEPMVMDVLLVLASHQGSVVTRDQLVDAVWDGRFVADEAIVAKIATLRHKLGDHAKSPTYIETVPRRGYRLMMPVEIPDSPEAEQKQPIYNRVSGPILIIGLVVLATAIYTWWAPAAKPIESVAVLQFKNLSDDKEKYAHVVAGFREELFIILGQEPNLRVAKGHEWSDDVTAQQLAKKLGVKALVNGSLRADGAKIRITAEIILSDGFSIWTSRFDRAAEDVFELQENVAAEVLNVLLVEPGGQIKGANRKPNSAASNTYSRGVFFLQKRDSGSLQRALVLFRETIQHDPDFGPAYLRLAITYLLLADFEVEQRRDLFEQAIEIANQGVTADPGIRAPATMIHGFVEHQFGNWSAASDAFATALGGVTVYPTAYNWHSRLLSALGLLDRALQQAKAALAMEPASQVLNARMASAYLWIGDMGKAREYFEEADKMEVGAPIHHISYTLFLIRENRIEEARASVKHAYQLLQVEGDWWIDPVFDGLAQPENQEIRNIAIETIEKMIAERVSPYITMTILVLFEQGDRVMELIMNIADSGTLYAYDTAQVEIIYLKEFKVLRDHEDFPTLLQKLGLTDYWASIGCRWANDQVVCDAT